MNTPYLVVTLEEIVTAINPAKPVFIDTETAGFYGEVCLLQVMQEGWDNVLLAHKPGAFEIIIMMGELNMVAHNCHYDFTTLQEQSGMTQWIPKNFEDTFLLARLSLPQYEKFSLDETFKYVLGYDPYERQGLNKKVLQKSKWDSPYLTKDQYRYAATDVYYMPALYNAVQESLQDFNYLLDKHTVRHCLNFQHNGMPVDEEKRATREALNKEEVTQIAAPINVNSWQQVRRFLGSSESDDEALAKMSAEGNEDATMVRKVRKLLKQNSFLAKFNAERIYGKFLPSTRSGRLASKDQNLQQLPRALKGVFGFTPDEGKVLIYADYAQLELRTICAITECTAMEQLFRQGKDLHGFTAEMLYGAEYTKLQRNTAKGYNFCLLYGGGIDMVITYMLKVMTIGLAAPQVNKDRRRWRNLWKELYTWQQKGISDWQRGKLGSTPLGRRYKAKMMTDQLNIENQGAGADVAKLALHYFMTKNSKPEVIICNFIHDSFILECPDDPAVYQEATHLLADCMQEAWFELSKCFKVKDLPMPVNVVVDYNWGDCEDEDKEHLYDYNLEPYKMLETVNAAI